MLTEIIADAKYSKSELYMTLMDTSKAFDVVSLKGMLNALHEQDLRGNLWKLCDSLYDNITSLVKWRGELSEPFSEKQRIKARGNSLATNITQAKTNCSTTWTQITVTMLVTYTQVPSW